MQILITSTLRLLSNYWPDDNLQGQQVSIIVLFPLSIADWEPGTPLSRLGSAERLIRVFVIDNL